MISRFLIVIQTIAVLLCAESQLVAQRSQNVTLLSTMNNYSSVGYNDVWGYTAPNGREYALLGVRNGTSIVDITNGTNPVEIEFIAGPSSTWKDLKTYQNYAYVVNESSGGMQIIDLSQLPNSATLVATYTGFSTSHNLYIDVANAMMYAEGSGSQPVRAISLADPVNPVQLSTFGIECHDIYARNNIVYVSEGSRGSIGIYDLSAPASPQLVNRFSIPNAGYVHNAWLSDDGKYLMTTEETTNKTVKYWDIQDLNNVRMTDQYLGLSRIAHNTHLKGNFAYISHYADGLKIVDVSDPENIFEAGFYDESNSTAGFNGAWGAFPFFASGKVLISDIQNGLWVFRFDQNAARDITLSLTPSAPPVVIPPGGGSFGYTLNVTNTTGEPKTVDVWTYAKRNGRGPTDFLFLQQGLTLSPGQTRTFNNTQVVPNVDAGNFTYYANAGTIVNTPVAGDGFPFQVNGVKHERRRLAKSEALDAGSWPVYSTESDGQQSVATEVPEAITLQPNFPNPFNPTTTIRYSLKEAAQVRLTIYNSLGQQVKTLVDGVQPAGLQSVSWDATNASGQVVAAGVYIYRLAAGGVVQTRKTTLAK